MSSKLQIERSGPMFVAIISAVYCWWLGAEPNGEVVKELLAALLSAAAIAAGFMTTALTVLLPIGSTPIGRQLKRRHRLGDLFKYVHAAIYSCFLLAIVCVVGLYQFEPGTGLGKATSAVIVGIAVHSVAAFLRILEILIRVLPQFEEPEDKDG